MLSENLHQADNLIEAVLLFIVAMMVFFIDHIGDFTAVVLFFAATGKLYLTLLEIIAKRRQK